MLLTHFSGNFRSSWMEEGCFYPLQTSDACWSEEKVQNVYKVRLAFNCKSEPIIEAIDPIEIKGKLCQDSTLCQSQESVISAKENDPLAMESG